MNYEPSNEYPDWGLLSAWVAVVESESVSHAAQRLGLSQAAVSMRIKLLESKLNIELLDRGTRPAKVTLAGQRLYDSTTTLIQRADEMMESVRGISRSKRTLVRLGCVDSLAATVGPTLFRALSTTTQQLRLWSGLTPSLVQQFTNRQLDAIITTARNLHQPGVVHTPLFSEQYLLVLPEGHVIEPFCSVSDLGRRLPLIRYSSRSSIGEDIDRFLERHGDNLPRTCEFDTSDPLLSLVAAGIGFAISTPMCIWQSRHFVPKLKFASLDTLRYRGRPYSELTRTFYLTFRQGEMGKLPKEIEELTRVAMNGHISADMESVLGLPREMILQSRSAEDE